MREAYERRDPPMIYADGYAEDFAEYVSSGASGLKRDC